MLDHAWMFCRSGISVAIVTEPYEFQGDDFARVLGKCSELGLKAYISGNAFWHPKAVRVVIKRREGPQNA